MEPTDQTDTAPQPSTGTTAYAQAKALARKLRHQDRVERTENPVTYRRDSRDKYRQQATDLRQQNTDMKGKAVADSDLMNRVVTAEADYAALHKDFDTARREHASFKARTRTELDERDRLAAEQVTRLHEVEDEMAALEGELDRVQQELDAAQQERDYAQNVLDQSQLDNQRTATQTQTQPAFDADEFFKKPTLPTRASRHQRTGRSRSRNSDRPYSHRREDRSPPPPTTRQTPAAVSAISSATKPKLDRRFPDPEIFTGADTSKYRMWRSKMKAKLRASYPADEDVQTLLDYVHSRTTGQAWQVIDNHTIDKKSPWLSMEEAWEQLDGMYQSRDEEAKAEMEFNMLKQESGQDYSKFMVSLKDVAARADREIKTNEVWMKLTEGLQRKSAHLRFKTFSELDDFCLDQESAHHAMKMLHHKTTGSKDDSAAGTGRGRGRGRGNPPDRRTQSAPAAIVRYIPRKYQNLPKAREPAEAARIRTNNLCFGCREPGHGAGDPQCIFAKGKGRYAFADVPHEMTAEQGNAYLKKNGGTVTTPSFGSATNNAISFNAIAEGQFDDHSLPAPEPQALITDGREQGNGSPHS